MNYKAITATLLTSLVSFSICAEAEHKLGLKGNYINQDASNDLLTGKSSDSTFGYGVEYTALLPFSTSPDNKAKVGLNLSFDAFELKHNIFGGSNNLGSDFDVFTIAPIFAYSIDNNIDVYTKIGMAFWDASLLLDEIPYSASLDGEDIVFGIGATYQSSNGAYSGIEITKQEYSDSGFSSDTMMLTIKAGFKFGGH